MSKYLIRILIMIFSFSTIIGCKKTKKENALEKTKVESTELKFGLTENQQKQLFKDIVKAEDRANKYRRLSEDKALELKLSKEKLKIEYAKIDKETKILMTKYKSEVLKKYNVTVEQEEDISEIAFENEWPLD